MGARWLSPPDLDESDNRMDFGQMVPLTLLAIPMLVATELFYGNYVHRHSEQVLMRCRIPQREEARQVLYEIRVLLWTAQN